MQWTLFELARLARNLVAEDDLVLRDSVIEKLVNKDERKDEDYLLTALGHKDGIVIALSENKGCQDNIDNIKLHI